MWKKVSVITVVLSLWVLLSMAQAVDDDCMRCVMYCVRAHSNCISNCDVLDDLCWSACGSRLSSCLSGCGPCMWDMPMQ